MCRNEKNGGKIIITLTLFRFSGIENFQHGLKKAYDKSFMYIYILLKSI